MAAAKRNVLDFQKVMKAFVEVDVPEAVNRVKRNVTFDLFSRIIRKTPVHAIDGGRLRGNWQITTGVQAASETGTTDPSGGGAKKRGAGVLGSTIGSKSILPSMFITNNVPYASSVEFGLYPRNVKLGTYIPKRLRGRMSDRATIKKRNAAGEATHVKFSAGGFSKQTPKGMVRVSVAETEGVIDRLVSASEQGIELTRVL